MPLKSVTPILYVSDFPRSMAYFTERLGFRKLWTWGEPPSFGAVARDKVELFLSLGGQGTPGTWMCIFVEDVDTLHEEFLAKGAVIRVPPRDEPWCLREMQVECPDGHVLRFGHPIATAPERVIERRELRVRLETRLASVLEDLAVHCGRGVGPLLEEILLHSFEPVQGEAGLSSASAFREKTFALIEQLKKKHGIDYDTHASYGFVEKAR